MKIHEIFKLGINEDQAFDLSSTVRHDPAEDKIGQAKSKHGRKPILTLRHINKLKKIKTAQREEHEQRKQLFTLMYGLPTQEE